MAQVGVQNIIGHKMMGNGKIMLKIQYLYLEIAIWESFSTLAKSSPKILNEYLNKIMMVNT